MTGWARAKGFNLQDTAAFAVLIDEDKKTAGIYSRSNKYLEWMVVCDASWTPLEGISEISGKTTRYTRNGGLLTHIEDYYNGKQASDTGIAVVTTKYTDSIKHYFPRQDQTYVFDKLGRILRMVFPEANGTRTTTSTYGADGMVATSKIEVLTVENGLPKKQTFENTFTWQTGANVSALAATERKFYGQDLYFDRVNTDRFSEDVFYNGWATATKIPKSRVTVERNTSGAVVRTTAYDYAFTVNGAGYLSTYTESISGTVNYRYTFFYK